MQLSPAEVSSGCALLSTLLSVSTILSAHIYAESPSRRACTTSNSTTATLPLMCPEGHVIHVQSWLTSLSHNGNISQCISSSDCASVRYNDSSNLATQCNGLQLCNDRIAVSAGDRCSNGTVLRYFQVEYECVPDNSTVSLCSESLVTANSTSLYLKTPAFPRGDNASNTTCVCEAKGQGLSVTVLELLFPNDMPASLSISNSSAELWRYTFSVSVFNRDVIASGSQTSLTISFHDRGGDRQMAWLRISSKTSPLSIGCGVNAHSTSPQPSPSKTSGTEEFSTPLGTRLWTGTDTGQTISTPESATASGSFTSVATSSNAAPSSDSSSQVGDIIAKVVPAAVSGVIVIAIVIVVVVICKCRQSRKRAGDLERIPGPQGDLYTMSKKKTRSPPPSAVSLFQDSNHHSDASQSSKTSPQDCLAPPLQVHHNPTFSPDAQADDKYVSTGSLAAHVYQEISDLDLDQDVVSPDRPVPEKNRDLKSAMFVSVSPTGAGSHSQEQNPYVKPKKQYWAVVADTNKENNGVENQNRTASQKYKEAQPYAVSGVFTRRKTTGAKVEVVPLKSLIFTESDATCQSKANGRSGKGIDLLSEANNERGPTKTQRQGNINNPAVKPISKMETSASAESESARATKSEREKYDPYADYEAVDMNDINVDFPDACPGVSDDVDPATCKTDFDPYAGYESVDFDDQGGNMMASYVSQSPEAGRKISQYEEIDCEDEMPSVRNTRNTEDCLVDNILYESSKGLGNASAMKPDRSETDSSSGMTESTDTADEESKVSNGTSIVDDYDENTAAQSKGSQDENCLVDNILYESSRHMLDPNV